ncbi:EamA family transporter RarD [Bacillus sp. WMMC1349]|uniref:EamA family transporter RarD n=1 Tax=Bacillus sp. WMMC1349 TaxID=2736254 RepID=UPI001554CF70|nr:EamA family transporter RarD [Bacillus sp. WMMC1349]NPC93100.1 EamA family transporter RarD [Bacillus sp. WMMC1349]
MNHVEIKGFFCAALAYLLWGLFPLYWKMLDQIAALDILAHRIVWSCVFMCGVLLFLKQWQVGMKAFKSLLENKKALVSLLFSTILISINWFVYIWAVGHGHILEASLGYYINPLISIVLGIVFLKERLSRMQAGAVLIAAIGVLISAFQYGSVPYIALILAFSFGLYGLVKKRTTFTSAIGLTLETIMITPVALIFLLFYSHSWYSAASSDPKIWLLLFLAGVLTAIPLLLFSEGAKKLPLYQIGILQYIAPTITLCLGVFVYHEPFNSGKALTFSCIWAALILFTFSQFNWNKRVKPLLKRKNAHHS